MMNAACLLTVPLVVMLAGAALTAAPDRRHVPDVCLASTELPPGDTDARRAVAVRISNQSSMRQAGLETMMEVTNRIWARYGVAIERSDDPRAVSVIVSNHPTGERAASAHATVIGTTLFTEGHATAFIKLSLGAAEAFAIGSQDGGIPFTSQPRAERDAMLERMMGVALAHELGHYLLDTAEHARSGLLQTGLSLRDFTHPEPAHLALTRDQQRQLCGSERLRPR